MVGWWRRSIEGALCCGRYQPRVGSPLGKANDLFVQDQPKTELHSRSVWGKNTAALFFSQRSPGSSFSHHLIDQINPSFFNLYRKHGFSHKLPEQPKARRAEGTSSKATLLPIAASAGICPQCAVVSSTGGTKDVVVG